MSEEQGTIKISKDGKLALTTVCGTSIRNTPNEADAIRAELSASQSTVEQLQGRVARLEEALKQVETFCEKGEENADEASEQTRDPMKEKFFRGLSSAYEEAKECVQHRLAQALADSPNWLQGRLREERTKERGRCAQVCDSQRHNTGKEWANWQAANCSALIRALPEE